MLSNRILSLLRTQMMWVGLAVLLAYWLWVHPPGWGRIGYGEDLGMCEAARQIMADSLREFGRPAFVTQRFMAPVGLSIPFLGWNLERDWIGAIFWNWNPEFPWLWSYFGLSLVVSYLGVGAILRRMGLSRAAAWGLALFAVLWNLPRHFKLWHHFEHLTLHWVYLAVFLDAWIWSRAVREKRFSLNLELWRAVLGVGMLGTAGYFWGPLIFEWILIRVGLLWLGVSGWKWEWSPRRAVLPLVCFGVLAIVAGFWFWPLFQAMKGFGTFSRELGWFSHVTRIFQPLWLETFFHAIERVLWGGALRHTPFYTPETVVTVGWVLWVPALLAVRALWKSGRAQVVLVLPQLLFLLMAVLYICGWPLVGIRAFQGLIPFLSFFRVAPRMALFFAPILVSVLALAWPELRDSVRELWGRRRTALRAFVVLGALELVWLLYPINAMPPLDPSLRSMMSEIAVQPGTTVLDLPFCVSGGNGVCDEQCPYGRAKAAMVLTGLHDKKVFGFYQARNSRAVCEIYERAPFTGWFAAWREGRCLSDAQWKGLCEYLEGQSEFSALLLYPDLWRALREPHCEAQVREHLGEPIREARLFTGPTRGGAGADPTAVRWYAPRCVSRSRTGSGD